MFFMDDVEPAISQILDSYSFVGETTAPHPESSRSGGGAGGGDYIKRSLSEKDVAKTFQRRLSVELRLREITTATFTSQEDNINAASAFAFISGNAPSTVFNQMDARVRLRNDR